MNFVLVHGAWLGAWCWDAVAESLRKQGHTVAVPELPGHGTDQTPLASISLDAYVKKVSEAIDASAVLVGHSMAGAVISQTAESIPEKIERLVYVSAYLLRNGENITTVSQQADDSLVPANMVFAPDYSTVEIHQEGLRDVFCADAPPDRVKAIVAKARPEPTAPFNTPVQISEKRFGKVPRAYIKTSQDRAVTPKLQALMLNRTPCDPVLTVESSHTPFLSRPAELARLIVQAASAKKEQAKGV